MNLPIIPGQKSNGKNGASVVSVPESTGIKISPAAIFADSIVESFPLFSMKIRCVFSITTIASSTIIPKPKSNAKSTMKFNVTLTTNNQICRRQKQKRHKHTKRHRKCHKKCIGNAHKKHQNQQDQYKSNHDGIYQIIKRSACRAALIAGDHHIQVCWQNMLPFISSTVFFTSSEV